MFDVKKSCVCVGGNVCVFINLVGFFFMVFFLFVTLELNWHFGYCSLFSLSLSLFGLVFNLKLYDWNFHTPFDLLLLCGVVRMCRKPQQCNQPSHKLRFIILIGKIFIKSLTNSWLINQRNSLSVPIRWSTLYIYSIVMIEDQNNIMFGGGAVGKESLGFWSLVWRWCESCGRIYLFMNFTSIEWSFI